MSRTVLFEVDGVTFHELGKPGNTDVHTALGWRRKHAPGARIKMVWTGSNTAVVKPWSKEGGG